MILTLLLALLFGLGQQAVLTHAITHTADWQQQTPQDDPSDTLNACAQCIAHANLGHIVAAAPFVFGAIPYTPPVSTSELVSADCTDTPHFRARAPPVFLA